MDIFCSICKSEGTEGFEFEDASGLVAHMNEIHAEEETAKSEPFDSEELLKAAGDVDKGYSTEMYGGPYKDTGTDRDAEGNIKKKKSKKDKGYGVDPETGQPYEYDMAMASDKKMSHKSDEDGDVNKAGKYNNKDDDDMDEDEEKAMRYKKNAKKSVDAAFDDEELAETVDAMPFLKSFVDSVKNAMGEMLVALQGQGTYVQGFNKSMAKNIVALHDELIGEIEVLKAEVDELGSSPMGVRKSALTPGDVQGRFGSNGNGSKLSKSQSAAMEEIGHLDQSEIADTLFDLVQKGEVSKEDALLYDATKEMTPLLAGKLVKSLS